MGTRPLLLGHRGARATRTVPENTIASFDLALEHGCDGIEFDVRLAGDGRALICHDPESEGMLIAAAASEQLQQLPPLETVLQRYQNRAFLDIELKVPGLQKITADYLRRIPPEKGFVVSSFLPGVLRDLRASDESIPVGLICESRRQLLVYEKLALTHVMPHYKLVNRLLVDELHAAALKVFVWTVNHEEDMGRVASLGVDGIISDNTALLVRTLRNSGT